MFPSKGGVFEIEVNGKLVYSKKKTGQFPNFALIIKEISSFLVDK